MGEGHLLELGVICEADVPHLRVSAASTAGQIIAPQPRLAAMTLLSSLCQYLVILNTTSLSARRSSLSCVSFQARRRHPSSSPLTATAERVPRLPGVLSPN